MRVLKFPVPADEGPFNLELPKDAELLCFTVNAGRVWLYVRTFAPRDDPAPTIEHSFVLMHSERELAEVAPGRDFPRPPGYVGTTIQGTLEWHLFESAKLAD